MQRAPESGCSRSLNRDDAPVVAITGGTGIVGRALVRQLLTDLPEHKLLLLTRSPARSPSARIRPVHADICLPNLGLDERTVAMLQDRADLFIHAAADIRFNLSLEDADRVNTGGTENALNLARGCRKLRHFAHVSTLYVAGRREGVVRERQLDHDAGYVNSYEASKHRAEELVFAAFASVPAAVYRLSSVADLDGNEGHVRQLLRFAAWAEHFPFLPGDPDAPVDLISADCAARALAALIVDHAQSGRVRHVCAGASALPVRTVLDRTFASYESYTGVPRPPVRLAPLAEFERLRAQIRTGSRISRAMDSLMTFIPHLAIAQPFDNTETSALLTTSGVSEADTDSVLSELLAQEFGEPAVALRRA